MVEDEVVAEVVDEVVAEGEVEQMETIHQVHHQLQRLPCLQNDWPTPSVITVERKDTCEHNARIVTDHKRTSTVSSMKKLEDWYQLIHKLTLHHSWRFLHLHPNQLNS